MSEPLLIRHHGRTRSTQNFWLVFSQLPDAKVQEAFLQSQLYMWAITGKWRGSRGWSMGGCFAVYCRPGSPLCGILHWGHLRCCTEGEWANDVCSFTFLFPTLWQTLPTTLSLLLELSQVQYMASIDREECILFSVNVLSQLLDKQVRQPFGSLLKMDNPRLALEINGKYAIKSGKLCKPYSMPQFAWTWWQC